MGDEGQTYTAAGVSIDKGEAVVERLRAAVESTGATGFGAFAGCFLIKLVLRNMTLFA